MLEIHQPTLCHGHYGSSPISPTIAIISAYVLINELLPSFCWWQWNRKVIACDYLFFPFHWTARCNVTLSFHPFLRRLCSAVVSCLMWRLCVPAMPCVCRGPQRVGEILLSHGMSVKHIFHRKLQCHWKCKLFPEEKHLHVHHWESGLCRINHYGIMMTLWRW